MTKRIAIAEPLTSGKASELIHYCPETGVMRWKPRANKWFRSIASAKSWNTRHAGKRAGCTITTKPKYGYSERAISIFGKNYKEHRIAWLIHHGEWPKGDIDHINGDALDNRIENLRDVSHQDNNRNMKAYSTSATGVTGVVWNKACGKWQSRITLSGKDVHLGLHKDFFEAVCKRKSEELQHGFHGNHGRAIVAAHNPSGFVEVPDELVEGE